MQLTVRHGIANAELRSKRRSCGSAATDLSAKQRLRGVKTGAKDQLRINVPRRFGEPVSITCDLRAFSEQKVFVKGATRTENEGANACSPARLNKEDFRFSTTY